ncbi:MAG TPA: DUF2971 domain-containing protein [Aeromonas salmonicida]|nr:DUF2971 domain-containing protein [Aeromonas salmonicida]HBL02212.1 DUF2971 domain-containing protein [Aeromonas salmonicida]
MILYKYISKKSLNYVFKDDCISIKFSPFSDFNDPFESYGSSIEPYDKDSLVHLTMRHELNNKIACLCLSRDPLSVLMWSHYGDKHGGFVIGFDSESAGFEDESDFIITASKGGINYRDERDGKGVRVTCENIYTEAVSNALLLNKSKHWSYESEVRIIKRTDLLDFDGDHLVHKITKKGAVKELYIGMRNHSFNEMFSKNTYLENIILNAEVDLYRCDFKNGTWDLDKEQFEYYKKNESEISFGDSIESLERIIRAHNRNKVG